MECFTWNGTKNCGKRRKCWLPAFTPLPIIIFKGLLLEGVKNKELCGKGLTLSQTGPCFYVSTVLLF